MPEDEEGPGEVFGLDWGTRMRGKVKERLGWECFRGLPGDGSRATFVSEAVVVGCALKSPFKDKLERDGGIGECHAYD